MRYLSPSSGAFCNNKLLQGQEENESKSCLHLFLTDKSEWREEYLLYSCRNDTGANGGRSTCCIHVGMR